MTTLNLTGQEDAKDEIWPKLVQLWGLMLDRQQMWNKIPEAKRQAWITTSPTKDPIMDIAFDVYKKLNNNFFSAQFGDFEGIDR